MKINEIEAISFSRDGFKNRVKSPVIWGHKGGEIFPLCYLTKPKWMPKQEWEIFLDRLHFGLKGG